MTTTSFQLTKNEKRVSLSLTFIFTLRLLGLFLLLPIFTIYSQKIPGGDNTFLVGLALGLYGLTQAFFQIPFGIASDYYGRKKVIIIGLILFAIGSFIAALQYDIYTVMVGRCLQGIGAISAAVTAFLSDHIREHVLPKSMGILGATIGLSFALSLIVAPFLGENIGLGGVFTIIGILAIMGIFITARIPEIHHHNTQPKEHWLHVILNTQLMRLHFGVFCLHAIQMALFLSIPLQLLTYDLPSPQHWHVYTPAIIIGLLCMFKPITWAQKNHRIVTLIRLAILMIGIALCGFVTIFQGTLSATLLLCVFFIGFNIIEATLPSLISRLSNPQSKGLALGIFNTSQSLGLFFGGAAGGYIYQNYQFAGTIIFSLILLGLWFCSTWQQKRKIH